MEHNQQQSLNEAIRRVALGEGTHSADDYTVKLKKKKKNKYDGEDDVTTSFYDIILNKKVVGQFQDNDFSSDTLGKLHGKHLPSAFGGGGEAGFRAFLKSRLFKNWSKNVKFFKDNPLQ